MLPTRRPGGRGGGARGPGGRGPGPGGPGAGARGPEPGGPHACSEAKRDAVAMKKGTYNPKRHKK